MTRNAVMLGRVVLSEMEARKLAEGAIITISAEQFRQHVTEPAHLGDLVWVGEPFYEYSLTGMFRVPPVIPDVVAGPRFQATAVPEKFKRYRHKRRYCVYGARLPRDRSRCTLEIISFDAGSLNCIAHMRNVEDFMAERRAAA